MTIRNFICRVCKGNNFLQEKRNLKMMINLLKLNALSGEEKILKSFPHLMNMFMSPKNHEMISFAGIIKLNKNKEMISVSSNINQV